MKFLCDNCKAKYQIPDEKVSGRTLRMKCRKCTFNIIIRGPRPDRVASTSTVPPDAPDAPKKSVPRPAKAKVQLKKRAPLGSAFRSRVAAPPPPMAAKADQKVWHCAINDVPIGPIKREELGRKIATKALSGDSLVWREGFDDWRPLKDIPELAPLLTRSRVPRAPSRPARPPARVPAPKAPAPLHAPTKSATLDRTAARAGGSNVIPIGGRMGASAAQAFVPAPAPEPPAPAPAAPEDEFEDEATILSDNPLQFLAKADLKKEADAAKQDLDLPAPRKPATGPFAKPPGPAVKAPRVPSLNEPSGKQASKQPSRQAKAAPGDLSTSAPPPPAEDSSLDLRFSSPVEAPAAAPEPDPFGLDDSADGGDDFGSAPLDGPLSGFAAPPDAGTEEDDDEAALILAGTSAAMPLSRSGGLPIGAWIAIAGAMAFGVALAIVVGTKLMQEPPAPVAVAETPGEATPATTNEEEPTPAAEVDDEPTNVDEEIVEATNTEAPDMAGQTKRTRRERSNNDNSMSETTASTMMDTLTEAQRRLIEEMGGDDTTSVMTKNLGRMSEMRGQPLDAAAVRRVVTNNANRRALQRCYNTAIRGRSADPPTVRYDIRVNVGPSGTVTGVRVNGSSELSGIKPCLERTVRRWRFPSSSGGATVPFPLVFTGAG